MLERLARWRPANLLLAWCVYWIALPLLWIAPAVPILYRLSKPDQHGNASLSYGDGGFLLTVEAAGRTALTQSVSLTASVLAAAIPPLLLWALWLRASRRARDAERVRV